MGERIPKSYLAIKDFLFSLQGKYKTESAAAIAANSVPVLPIVDLDQFTKKFGDTNLVKRTLDLFSKWGDCVYFSNPPELSSTVVLDPTFLTKEVLAQLFNPALTKYKENGILNHADLIHIWSGFKRTSGNFESLAAVLMTLMERFEVSFRITEEGGKEKPFLEQRSIIPALLPNPSATNREGLLRRVWPIDPPFQRAMEIERALLFNTIPPELIARFLVRLHPFIQGRLAWRNEVVIFKPKENTQAWIRVSIPDNSFCATLRGSDLQSCISLMNFIVEEMQIVCQAYPGVKWVQAIRSPYSQEALIGESLIKDDLDKPLDQRTLTCPETHFPLKAEFLLHLGGYLLNDGGFYQ